MRTTLNGFLFLLFFVPTILFGQNTITGTVTEQSTSLPLPGVNVLIKDTTTGAATDFDGNYQIEANNGDVLVFSYVGYVTQEITYQGQSTIDVQLLEDAAQLDEVVVIGYGTTTVKDATGSVGVISSDEFNGGAIISPDQLLNGKIAGVRITNSGGQPDAAPNIRIRGGASLNANNNPLIVIDGVPIDIVSPAGVSNPLNLINPNDIDSFSVLKDASATAIYGSRASNGVIIITTKRGTSGEPQFNFSSDMSVSQVTKEIDVFDGFEFVRFIKEFYPRSASLLGVPAGSTLTTERSQTIQVDVYDENGNIIGVEDRTIYNTDWQNEIFRAGISTNHNFSARANLFEGVPFRASVGYNRTEGVVRTNDYERLTASLKLTPKFLDDHLKLDVNAKASFSDKNAIDEGGALGGAVFMDPTKPVFDRNSIFGGYYNNLNNENNLDGQSNPVALLKQRERPERAFKFIGNAEFDYKFHFLPELRAVVNLGLEASRAKIRESFSENALATYRRNGNESDTANDIFVYEFNPGVNYRENQHITNTTFDAYLVYNKDFEGALNSLEVTGGYAYQNFKNDGNKEIYRYNIDTGLRELEPNEGNPNNRYLNQLNLQSFFGRTQLNFYDKYLLTLSVRADASSLFVKTDIWDNDVWGIFPAAAFAWKINEEKFLEDSNIVNTLKLRLGWGKTGQQDVTQLVGYYPSIPLFSIGSASSQYLPGVPLYSANPFNPDLTWEKTTTYNAGIDFDLFANGLLSGVFDIYKRDTEDLLADAPVGPGQGLTDRFVQNVGQTESKGFELALNLNPIQKEELALSVNYNVAYNKTEVTDLKDVSVIDVDETRLPIGTGVFLARNAVGEEAYSAWIFKQVYDTDGNPIPGAFVDLNGDNRITNDDRYYKPLRPNWTYGFGFTLNYKNWDLSSNFRGQIGGNVFNARRLTSGYTERALPLNTQNLSNTLDFYSGAANPVFEELFRDNNVFSDYFVEDATFMRCENIILGYSFPNFLKDASLKVYGAVNNPFIITDYDGQDPENFNSIDDNFYPRPRVYTLGLNIDF